MHSCESASKCEDVSFWSACSQVNGLVLGWDGDMEDGGVELGLLFGGVGCGFEVGGGLEGGCGCGCGEDLDLDAGGSRVFSFVLGSTTPPKFKVNKALPPPSSTPTSDKVMVDHCD